MSEDAARGQVAGSAAEVYESFFVPALFAQWPPVLLDAAAVASGHRVLDVGCGTGIVAAAAASSVGPQGRVAALDPNVPMLEVAGRRPEPVSWHEGVAEAMPFGDGEFDRVLSAFAAHVLHRPAAGGGRDGAGAGARRRGRARDLVLGRQEPGLRHPDRPGRADRRPGRRGGSGGAVLPRRPGPSSAIFSTESFDDVSVVEHPGVARFESIAAWMHTDVRGWTLAGLVDDVTFDRLVDAAQDELARFTDPSGRVEFAAPALITTGRQR